MGTGSVRAYFQGAKPPFTATGLAQLGWWFTPPAPNVKTGKAVGDRPPKAASKFSPGASNPRPRPYDQLERHLTARHSMFKIVGVVIWVSLFAIVMTSVVRSEKINATPHSGQLHHTAKAQH
jgi:hypothetical protein